ncbi:MAG: DUF5069 domain-containing protein [Verrucomicrobia bacterium]|nr:DUF5069 domain-containing protein [Verrucomicrobiota bacterium]
MKHYDFAQRFRALYDKAVGLYAKGQRGPETFFSTAELAWLAANGLTAQNLYDYAEDHNNYGEPGPENALAIETIRRDHFLNVQGGRPSTTVIDVAKMPAKTDAVRGVEWLPRLIPKSKAKLRGELPSSLMFCCGGDRAFFQKHDVLPAEFLAVVSRHMADDAAIVDWLVKRSAATGTT